jgi:nitrous oxidase accessory protein NosD
VPASESLSVKAVTRVRVKNCDVTSFTYGIFLENADRNALT